jgi:hypothetical protein
MTYAQVVNGTVTQLSSMPVDGWYEVSYTPPTYDPDTQYLGAPVYTVTNNAVTETTAVISRDPNLIAVQLVQEKARLSILVDGSCVTKLNAGFTFAGKPYQTDAVSVTRLQSASIAALAAIAAGHGAPGNLRWADPNTDFAWIATDNTMNTMDAPTLLAFAMGAVALGQKLILFSRALKDQLNAAADFPTLRAIDLSTGWPS